MKPVVYFINDFLKPVISSLNKDWIVYTADMSLGHEQKAQVKAIATSVWDKLDSVFLSQFPNLELLCHLGIGTDKIDTAFLKSKNIKLICQPQAGVYDTAELAISLMLCLARKIVPNHLYTAENQWPGGQKRNLGHHLYGKKLGLLGLGQIGLKIAEFAQVFSMDIAYAARSPKDKPYRFFHSIEKLADWSDFLIICCSGGISTKHLVNASVIEALGSSSYLINVARGSVVDEQALIQALENKSIAGAALDVYENEPEIPVALRKMDQVLHSPHMGSSTHENLDKMYRLQARQLNEYLIELQDSRAFC